MEVRIARAEQDEGRAAGEEEVSQVMGVQAEQGLRYVG